MNTLVGVSSLEDFNTWKNEKPKYTWEPNTFSNSSMLRKRIISRAELEALDKKGFLIGSRFSYFNSLEPLIMIPRIDDKVE